MYHSITFGDKNTYDDWHLISRIRPAFAPPTQKTNYIDIPGASSTLDLSESITGYPVFNDREGSFDFLVLNDHQPWYQLYSDIMGYLHGKRLKAELEDDKGWYYEGRFTVGSYSAGDSASNPWSKLTINYKVGPYKWSSLASTDDWLWDPFNFFTGIILTGSFKNIKISTSELHRTYSKELLGDAPICPEFIVESTGKKGATLRLVNPTLGIDVTKDVPEGNTTLYDFIFYGDDITLYFKAKSGTGTISIKFNQGRL